MKKILFVLGLVALFLFPTVHACGQTGMSGYRIIDSLLLGGEGGWDYLTVDTAAERLYVSRGTRVQVIDLVKNSIVGEIPNSMGVHGVAVAPVNGKGYTSNGG